MPLSLLLVSLPVVLSLAITLLGGCRAMETHDLDGRAYGNDEREFYASGKRSSIHRRGYAYAWHSGDLAGQCSSAAGEISDEVVIEATSLFDTDSHRLGPVGEAILDQLLERIGQYTQVREVMLRGHADERGSHAYNDALSARRNASVRRYLEARLAPGARIVEESLGEREPLRHGSGAEALQANRRVVVRVLAGDVAPGRGSVSLCARPGGDESARSLKVAARGARGAGDLGRFGGSMPLSPGDRVRLRVLGDDDLDGLYEIGADGTLDLPFVGTTPATGLRADELERRLERRLVDEGLVRAPFARVDVGVLQWSSADVYVRGAVFDPGRKTVNALQIPARSFKQTQDGGDHGRERLLSTALVAAGGVRPDADLSAIRIRRGNERIDVDISGILGGYRAEDLPLVNGDEIEVPSLGVFQEGLVRPTQITPPGIRVFISNLSTPSPSNASSAVGKDSSSMPYGTRFLHALLSANCIGGTQYTNASRRAVLISVNPLSGRTEVIERSIQQLVSDPDRDSINPLLMPNDGIACYDSEVTNIRDVARAATEILTPFALLRTLFGEP